MNVIVIIIILTAFDLGHLGARSGTHMVFYPDGGKYTGPHLRTFAEGQRV